MTPSEAMAARRKCTIVEEDDEEAYEEEQEIIEAKIVRDDSCVSRSSRSSIPDAHHNLDLAWIQGQLTSSKPLISIEREGSTEATPAPFPVTSQIGTGLSRQGSLRRYVLLIKMYFLIPWYFVTKIVLTYCKNIFFVFFSGLKRQGLILEQDRHRQRRRVQPHRVVRGHQPATS